MMSLFSRQVQQTHTVSAFVMLYDGDCGLCSQFALFAQRLDTEQKFCFVSFQSYLKEDKMALQLSEAKFQRGLYLIDRSNTDRIRHGVFALNDFFGHFFPFNLLVILLYIFPPLLLVEMLVYQIVAKYRSNISKWLGLNYCPNKK